VLQYIVDNYLLLEMGGDTHDPCGDRTEFGRVSRINMGFHTKVDPSKTK